MKKKVAEIELTPEEAAQAIAYYISQTRLSKSHFWNSYTLTTKFYNGEFAGAVVRYFLDEEERDKN